MGLVCSDHRQAMAERVSLSSMLAKSQDDLPPKRMKDSYLEVHLPLGSEPQLREKYLTFHNTVRYTHARTSHLSAHKHAHCLTSSSMFPSFQIWQNPGGFGQFSRLFLTQMILDNQTGSSAH